MRHGFHHGRHSPVSVRVGDLVIGTTAVARKSGILYDEGISTQEPTNGKEDPPATDRREAY